MSNVLGALSDLTSLANSSRALQGLSEQLAYAGVNVSVGELGAALEQVSVSCPSTFQNPPPISQHYTPYGTEYRIRQRDALKQARACVDAVYAETDLLPRSYDPNLLGGGVIEMYRPNAFARCLGHLRVRWAKGNYSVPRPSTIRRWWSKEQRAAQAA